MLGDMHEIMLEYNGGTPQQALFGHVGQAVFNVDTEIIESVTGAFEDRPDYIEKAIRVRLLAKQVIAECIVEDRLCRAAAMHQHQHPKALLIPGTQVDIWVQPPKSTQDG